MDAPVSVLAVDGHPLYRDALARVVRQRPALRLAGEVAEGRLARAAIARLAPDVAVLDPTMPGLDGLRLLAALNRDGVRTRVMLLASEVRPGDAYEALAAGASGYLSKRSTADQLAEAITRVASGQTVI